MRVELFAHAVRKPRYQGVAADNERTGGAPWLTETTAGMG
jgi:hypothetical protein